MATIDRRPDRPKPWRVRYRDPAGRQRTRSFRRKVDAERFRVWVLNEQMQGMWIDPDRGRVPVGEWVEHWYELTTDLRPSTRLRLRGVLDLHVLPEFGTQRIGTVTHLQVRQWTTRLLDAGLAPRTVRKIVQTFGKLMAAAVDARLIKVSPAERVPLPVAEHQEMRFLTVAQVLALADAIDERYRAMILVAGFGGLRMGELVGLRRRRVDPALGRVEVIETGVEAGGQVRFGPPKTRAGRRVVLLPDTARVPLVEHLDERTGTDGDALVFTAPSGAVLRGASWRQRFWKPAIAAASVAPLRVHDLRHTAISLWIAAGDNPKEISRRAGHSSVAFTLDRYGHLYPEADDRSRARLEALIDESRDGDRD